MAKKPPAVEPKEFRSTEKSTVESLSLNAE